MVFNFCPLRVHKTPAKYVPNTSNEIDFLNTDCASPEIIGNDYCNDETNNEDCNYDGGDCCVNINTENCLECQCLAGGMITSPGFPENYENNLDMYWLVQVDIEHIIAITFTSFGIESHSSCG